VTGSAYRLLSLEQGRAGHLVGGGVAPLVELDAGVVGAVDTGNLSSGAELSSARGLDVELEALNVELSLATMPELVGVLDSVVRVDTYT
jgi:hypothetical protein